MKKVLVLIILGLFFGCTKKGEVVKEDGEIRKPYIISQEDRKFRQKIKNNNVPYVIIPIGISVESNLIIDKYSNVYYYQRARSMGFGNDYMENDTIPRFIDLLPKDLIKIPKDCIERFINENVIDKEKRRQVLIMASQTDTIKDKCFLSFLKNIKTPIYVVRRTTQEEDTVLHYKKKDLFYDSNSIKWDKAKIRFQNQ